MQGLVSLMRGNRGEGVREIHLRRHIGCSDKGCSCCKEEARARCQHQPGHCSPYRPGKVSRKVGLRLKLPIKPYSQCKVPEKGGITASHHFCGLFLAARKPKSLSHWSGAQSKPCWLGVFRVKLAPSQGGCISVWLHGKMPCGVPWPPTVLPCACCRPPDSGGLDLGYLTEASSRIRRFNCSHFILGDLPKSGYSSLEIAALFTPSLSTRDIHTPPIQY